MTRPLNEVGRRIMRRSGALCALCGLAAGNGVGIPVHRYPLRRSFYPPGWKAGDDVRHRTVATIALCDRCIIEVGQPTKKYVRRAK